MSFIIQGVDLPKGYKALHMRVQSDGVVRYLIEGDDPVHIIDGARAIQIPKDHGDIKDVSDLIKAIDHAHDNVWNRDDWLDLNMRDLLRDTKKRIEKLTTILEAEETNGEGRNII